MKEGGNSEGAEHVKQIFALRLWLRVVSALQQLSCWGGRAGELVAALPREHLLLNRD